MYMVALRVFLSRFRFYLEIDFPSFSLSLSVILIFSYQARIFPIIYHASDKSRRTCKIILFSSLLKLLSREKRKLANCPICLLERKLLLTTRLNPIIRASNRITRFGERHKEIADLSSVRLGLC